MNGFVRIYSKDVDISFKNHLTKSDYWVWMYLTSTGVAALSLGRNFIGCEMNEDYVEISVKRLENTVLI